MRGKQWSKKDLAKLPKGCPPLVFNKIAPLMRAYMAANLPPLSQGQMNRLMLLQRRINLHESLALRARTQLEALLAFPVDLSKTLKAAHEWEWREEQNRQYSRALNRLALSPKTRS